MCNNNIDDRARQVADAIRGSLMAGAAGDALGYEVEFMSRHSILARFGGQGITRFALDSDGKALISDDTQMSLFTANGMLTGLTRGKMCGMATRPEDCVRQHMSIGTTPRQAWDRKTTADAPGCATCRQ